MRRRHPLGNWNLFGTIVTAMQVTTFSRLSRATRAQLQLRRHISISAIAIKVRGLKRQSWLELDVRTHANSDRHLQAFTESQDCGHAAMQSQERSAQTGAVLRLLSPPAQGCGRNRGKGRPKGRAGRECTQADRHPLMTKLLWLVPSSAGQRGALSRGSLPGFPSWLMPQGAFPENKHAPGRGFRRGSRGTFRETLQQDQETAGAERGRGVGAGRWRLRGVREGGSRAMPPFGPAPRAPWSPTPEADWPQRSLSHRDPVPGAACLLSSWASW